MDTIKKILFLLSPAEQKKAILLLVMISIMALIDMIGVASILPFVTVLSNPEFIETNLIINKLFVTSKNFGVTNEKEFLFYLGIIVFILLVFSLAFKSLTTFIQVRFVQMREYTIGRRLIEGYLHQPYSWFLNKNSADLGKNIFSEVAQVVGNAITPLIDVIAKGMIAAALISLLIFTDPKLALVISISIGSSYFLIFFFIKNYLKNIGNLRLKHNKLRFIALNEAFGAAKEVKISGLEDFYIKRFSKSAKIFAKTTASLQVLAQLPRYFLEAISFGGILLIIIYIMSNKGSFAQALPIISLYAFAGYRLMPALQQIYSSFTLLTFAGPALNKLYKDVKYLKSFKIIKDRNSKLSFKNQIKLKDINFRYPNSSRTILKNVNLNIPAKTTVGLIGATGSGKTTTVDIILGLLEPQTGSLIVDNQMITSGNHLEWQKLIGYVPQNIYLADDTIAANIAFGEDKVFNYESLERASKIANLHEFVINDLPEKYQTIIGERGIRLSGGQRQRIGIARAMYHNPKILVLDEATSSLDNKTEDSVMKAINNLSKDITIILIAHRLNTVKNCDIIYKFENGAIIAKGSYEQLINN